MEVKGTRKADCGLLYSNADNYKSAIVLASPNPEPPAGLSHFSRGQRHSGAVQRCQSSSGSRVPLGTGHDTPYPPPPTDIVSIKTCLMTQPIIA